MPGIVKGFTNQVEVHSDKKNKGIRLEFLIQEDVLPELTAPYLISVDTAKALIEDIQGAISELDG